MPNDLPRFSHSQAAALARENAKLVQDSRRLLAALKRLHSGQRVAAPAKQADRTELDEIRAELCGSLGTAMTSAREEAFGLLSDNATAKVASISTAAARRLLQWWRTSTIVTRGRKSINLSADIAPRIRQVSSCGGALLHHAATLGNPWTVAVLVDVLGVDVNATDLLGRTAAHRAAAEGQQLALRALLCRGADPGLKDASGRTAREHMWARLQRLPKSKAFLFRGELKEQDTYSLIHDAELRRAAGEACPWGVSPLPDPEALQQLLEDNFGRVHSPGQDAGSPAHSPSSPSPSSSSAGAAGAVSTPPPSSRTQGQAARASSIATPSAKAVERAATTVPHLVMEDAVLGDVAAVLGDMLGCIMEQHVRRRFACGLVALFQSLSSKLSERSAACEAPDSRALLDAAFGECFGEIEIPPETVCSPEFQAAARRAYRALPPLGSNGAWGTGLRDWLSMADQPSFSLPFGSPSRSLQSFVLVLVPAAGLFPGHAASSRATASPASLEPQQPVTLRVTSKPTPEGDATALAAALKTQTCEPCGPTKLCAFLGPFRRDEASTIHRILRERVLRRVAAVRAASADGSASGSASGSADGNDEQGHRDCDAFSKQLLEHAESSADSVEVLSRLVAAERGEDSWDGAEVAEQMARHAARNLGSCVCPSRAGEMCPFLVLEEARLVLKERDLDPRRSLTVCDPSFESGRRLGALEAEVRAHKQQEAAEAQARAVSARARGLASSPAVGAGVGGAADEAADPDAAAGTGSDAAARSVRFVFDGSIPVPSDAAGGASSTRAVAPRAATPFAKQTLPSESPPAAGSPEQGDAMTASARDLSVQMAAAGEEEEAEEEADGNGGDDTAALLAEAEGLAGGDDGAAEDAVTEQGLLAETFQAWHVAAEAGAGEAVPTIAQASGEQAESQPAPGLHQVSDAAGVFGDGWDDNDDSDWASPQPEPVATPQPEPVASPQPEPVASPQPEPVATPQPEPVASPQPEPVASPQPEPEPEQDGWGDDDWDSEEQGAAGSSDTQAQADTASFFAGSQAPAGESVEAQVFDTGSAAAGQALTVDAGAQADSDAPLTLSPSDGTTPTKAVSAAAAFQGPPVGAQPPVRAELAAEEVFSEAGSTPGLGTAAAAFGGQPAAEAFGQDWPGADDGAASQAAGADAASLFQATASSDPRNPPAIPALSQTPMISRAQSDEASSFFTPVPTPPVVNTGAVSDIIETADASDFMAASPAAAGPAAAAAGATTTTTTTTDAAVPAAAIQQQQDHTVSPVSDQESSAFF